MNKIIASMIVVMVITITALAPVANAFYIGQTGDDVAELQAALLESGYDIPAISSGKAQPGYFGPQTQKALTAYESGKSEGLKLGSVVGPDLYSPFWNVNGYKIWPTRIGLSTATNTPCAIRAPLGATSTLTFGSIRFNVSSTSATFVEMAKATTRFATTTAIGGSNNIAANAQATLIASTSPAGGSAGAAIVFAPGEWFVIKMAGGSTNSYSPVGACQAVFTEV